MRAEKAMATAETMAKDKTPQQVYNTRTAKSSKKPSIEDKALSTLKSKNLLEQISADITAISIAGEKQLGLTLYIIMTSHLLDKPLSAIVQGASSSGKSYILEAIAKLIPPEKVVQAHDFTEQSFYYLPPDSLKHKVVICGERLLNHRGKEGQAKENSKAFREMVGSGVLRKAVTVRKDGKQTTEMIEQQGPIAYLESTTATTLYDEDTTRLLPLVIDESAEQTGVVIEAQRQEDKGQVVSEAKKQALIECHHAMQKLLNPVIVRIPYINSLSLPTNRIVTRRTFGHLRSMIKAVALLRQYQKEMKRDKATGQKFIEADEIDYEIVYRLIRPILSRIYSPLNPKSSDLLKVLLEKTRCERGSSGRRYRSFTNQDCQDWTGLSEPTIRRRLPLLVSAGIVDVVTSGKPYRYRVVRPEAVESVDIGLPKPKEIAKQVRNMSA